LLEKFYLDLNFENKLTDMALICLGGIFEKLDNLRAVSIEMSGVKQHITDGGISFLSHGL